MTPDPDSCPCSLHGFCEDCDDTCLCYLTLVETTPIYDDLAAKHVVGDRVDTEYQVLVAQAVMDLLAGRS